MKKVFSKMVFMVLALSVLLTPLQNVQAFGGIKNLSTWDMKRGCQHAYGVSASRIKQVLPNYSKPRLSSLSATVWSCIGSNGVLYPIVTRNANDYCKSIGYRKLAHVLKRKWVFWQVQVGWMCIG